MCTAIAFLGRGACFARNLDLEYSLGESVICTPENYPLSFRCAGTLQTHYPILGAGVEREGYPLYYDGMNDRGLCMAGLAFPEYAHYPDAEAGSVAPFELIPWVLGQCATVAEAEKLLCSTHLGAIQFSPDLPLTPMHWIVSDGTQALVIEPRAHGLDLLPNPTRVLANSPPLAFHLENLRQYLSLQPREPENTLAPGLDLRPFSRGTGAMGLPGDLSSPSRFLRACYALHNSGEGDIQQALRILQTVSQAKGLVQLDNGLEYTRYTGICCPSQGLYAYTTYENPSVTAIDMTKLDTRGRRLQCFPMEHQLRVHMAN